MNREILLCAIVSVCLSGRIAPAATNDSWKTLSSLHFLVKYTDTTDDALAKTVSERAESYYSTIASDLGYTRYQNFWLWDNRVKILIYPTAQSFADACDAPSWAAGRANAAQREIASYRQSGADFISALLPHEMSHLILGDFIGPERVPLWLTEGFAQWEQTTHDSLPAFPFLAQCFKIKDLVVLDIRKDSDRQRVALFYAQSLSVVGFLIKTRGGESFGHFCRALRDGKTVEAALIAAYPDDIPSLDVLETKWSKAVSP